MGCDGGTIPTRDELVKTKKKPELKDKDSVRLYRWRHCSVSQSVLQPPIVACELGRLYSKEEVISRLLSKAKDPAMSHIKSLKDIKELVLTRNPIYREDVPRGDEYIGCQSAEYICPITSQEMNGRSKFFFIWTCGCVISERALKEIKSDRCHICNRTFDQADVIALNATEEESLILEDRMRERREKKKREKKGKKRTTQGDGNAEEGEESKKKKKTSSDQKESSIGGKSAAGVAGSSSSSISSYASSLLRSREFERVRSAEFSVASDKSKSEVFKSIFDSHESAKNKRTGHWVTCNPQYF